MPLVAFYRRHFRETIFGTVVRSLIRASHAVVAHLAFAVRWLCAAPLRLGSRIAGSWRNVWQRAWNLWYRAKYVTRYYAARLKPALPWLLRSRETSNFTYDLTERNKAHIASALAVVLKRRPSELRGYIDELSGDNDLKAVVAARVKLLGRGVGLDPDARFGRRIGWYALVRALKPKVVVETGVEKGLGATVLCAALLKNASEGHPGLYFGTDIDPGAGILFVQPYRSTGEILCGDSIRSLEAMAHQVDLFINDSDHSADYEAREYRVILPKLSENGIIIGDNAHVTDELYKFSEETGRRFLFVREEPADHWYLGAGIGLSFK